jgi:proliferating cell nuclear antigen
MQIYICSIDASILTTHSTDSDRIAEYDTKLSTPTPSASRKQITTRASEFSCIVKDLACLGESVRIEVSKEGMRFASDGEGANGSVLLKQTDAARREYAHLGKDEGVSKIEDDADDEEEPGEVVEGDDEEDEGGSSKKKVVKTKDVEMNGDDDEDGEEEFKPKSDDEGEAEQDGMGMGRTAIRKSARRRHPRFADPTFSSPPLMFLHANPLDSPLNPLKKLGTDSDGDADRGVSIEMNQHVTLTFSLKYLVNDPSSSTLSSDAQLMMSNDVPLLVGLFLSRFAV